MKNEKVEFTLAEGATHVDCFTENEKFGFTLAEVLITLGIIGVVAALTMPTLINDTKNMQYVAGLKKANSVLSQANELVQIDNPSSNWNIKSPDDVGVTKTIYELFKPHLKITKDCGCGDNTPPGCWSDDLTKALNGQKYLHAVESGIRRAACAVRLADGMNVVFDIWDNHTLSIAPSNSPGMYAFFMFVDVNGDKKPNMLGKDVFALALLQDKGILVPAGIEGDSPKCKISDTTNIAGLDCAAKVLKEGKISY